MDEWTRIWKGLQATEPWAFEVLLERLGKGVWSYLHRMTGSATLADDLFGQTWVRLVETAHGIESPRAIRQYVFTLARREWIDAMRRQRHDPLGETAELTACDAPPTSDAPVDALQALATEEDVQRLRVAVEGLPDPLREVVVLRVFVGLKFREVADVLDLPIGTVLTRMRKATDVLARELE